MSQLLEVSHLKTYFKTGGGFLHAVDDISFTLDEGKTLGVVGESGCGKSTLGRTILGLQAATSGSVKFDGKEIIGLRGSARKKIISDMQMIFQDPFSSLNPHYCVYELIADPLKVYHVCHGKKELDARVRQLMDTVGLAERFMFSYPHELDGGRRQRIGIARALALEPRFIVCDEPVSALDVSGSRRTRGPIGWSPTTSRWSSTFPPRSWSCIWAAWWRRARPRSCSGCRCTPIPRACCPPSRSPASTRSRSASS